METLENVITTISRNDYMASVDLKDAFFSIPIHEEHQKFFKFVFDNTFYKFLCMPNGYGPAMRTFTKVMKVPFSFLRKKSFTATIDI